MVTKGLRISPTGAMQQMHHLFRYQKVKGPNIRCAPLNFKVGGLGSLGPPLPTPLTVHDVQDCGKPLCMMYRTVVNHCA